jgi:hypothetical protein
VFAVPETPSERDDHLVVVFGLRIFIEKVRTYTDYYSYSTTVQFRKYSKHIPTGSVTIPCEIPKFGISIRTF